MSTLSLKDLSQMHEVLVSKDNKLRTLIDHLPDYIYFKDTKSRFIDANKATLRIMKCKSLNDCIGRTDFDFYPKEFAEKYFADECEIFRTEESKLDIEERTPDENGNLRYYSTSKVILKDTTGKVIGLVGIGRDITERKQAESILKRDNETLESIVRERTKALLEVQSEFAKAKRLSDIGTLTAIVGHELRNPLGVIKIAIYNLKKDKALVENKHLVNIEKKVWEGNRIIDNLLNYSRIKAPFYEAVNLHDLVDECVSTLPDNPEDYKITVEKKYEIQESSIIEIDPYQIKEVFINIFNNACQALSQKNGKIEVSIQARGDNHVGVSFKDNGIGIDEKDLSNIFIPFFTSKSKGTGLGLAICKELIELHYGKIEVQSKKGEGTTFCIVLPLRKP